MQIEFSKRANLPTRFGSFYIQCVRQIVDGQVYDHLVVFTKEIGEIPLVRIHSECLTGDVFSSLKCDCGGELALAMEQIAASSNGGMLLYLRQEGRGIGLFNKVNAYALQDEGLDTVQANEALGFPKDARSYEIIGEIFKFFKIQEIELLTNNPRKVKALEPYVKVSRTQIIVKPNSHNKHYLEVKKQKLGHLL